MRRPRVVVVGAGAAGTLVAIHLVRVGARRRTGLDVVLVDPAERGGRGTAFGTDDDQHLLNVPASGMSALPDDPGHFVGWRRRREDPTADACAFAPRRQFASYLDDTLIDAIRSCHGECTVRHVRQVAVSVRRTTSGATVTTADGNELAGEAVVIATGLPAAGDGWAPEGLRRSAFFVTDPWARGGLDVVRRDWSGPADVLLVGTGLTMVDVALSLSDAANRPDRRVVAISRHGRFPHVHAAGPRPAAIPDVTDWGHTLASLRHEVSDYLAAAVRTTGDWRSAVDGLRFRAADLWCRLDEDDRAEFLTRDASAWNVLRHRMPPTSAAVLRALQDGGRLTIASGQVGSVEPMARGGLRVRLRDGAVREVGWVVNCTGPQGDVRLLGDAFVDDLLRPRGGAALAVPASGGLGVCTCDGRLIDGAGSCEAPLWTLGALRRGELWESTAVPEIRSQALAVATSVLDCVASVPRRLADGRLVSAVAKTNQHALQD